jgi:hypothetical protein
MPWKEMTEVDMSSTIFIVGVFVTATLLSLWIDWMGDVWKIAWWIRGVVWMGMLLAMLIVVLWVVGALG